MLIFNGSSTAIDKVFIDTYQEILL